MRRSVSARLGLVVAGAALAVLVGGITLDQASAAGSVAPPSLYNAITPCRLADTRPSTKVGPRAAPLGPNDTATFDARGSVGQCVIPASAIALQLNVTPVNATTSTFLTIFPSDAPRPTASSLNPSPTLGPTPNSVTTALSADGRFNVFNLQGTVDVVIDIVGFYADAGATIATAISGAAPKVIFNVGVAQTIPANQCLYVFAFGVGAAGDAGKIVSGFITDSGATNPPPSINNLTMFFPGTVFKTSQGGTIGFVGVCNPTTSDKDLPAGWQLKTKTFVG